MAIKVKPEMSMQTFQSWNLRGPGIIACIFGMPYKHSSNPPTAGKSPDIPPLLHAIIFSCITWSDVFTYLKSAGQKLATGRKGKEVPQSL
ncbi:hypothetical protein [Dictyobacter vulcani]|uniref:hypothetical protein n=1 Tax=Dictyobacter vulcani TaxID=2607529 RepID=UPI0012506F06|nr:hypothetical protein [Dictyobacter vulcani]